MLDQTLTQLLNELYRLTAQVQQAARELEQKDAELETQSGIISGQKDYMDTLLKQIAVLENPPELDPPFRGDK